MMPLLEIDSLKRTVTAAWESPVADEVAAAWGYLPGTAKWWRSSASHVFVLPDPNGKRYLRFVPGSYRDASPVAAVSALMERLAAGGAAVVRPVPAQSGTSVVTVQTELGPMHAMVVEAAPGDELDSGYRARSDSAGPVSALERDSPRVPVCFQRAERTAVGAAHPAPAPRSESVGADASAMVGIASTAQGDAPVTGTGATRRARTGPWPRALPISAVRSPSPTCSCAP